MVDRSDSHTGLFGGLARLGWTRRSRATRQIPDGLPGRPSVLFDRVRDGSPVTGWLDQSPRLSKGGGKRPSKKGPRCGDGPQATAGWPRSSLPGGKRRITKAFGHGSYPSSWSRRWMSQSRKWRQVGGCRTRHGLSLERLTSDIDQKPKTSQSNLRKIQKFLRLHVTAAIRTTGTICHPGFTP